MCRRRRLPKKKRIPCSWNTSRVSSTCTLVAKGKIWSSSLPLPERLGERISETEAPSSWEPLSQNWELDTKALVPRINVAKDVASCYLHVDLLSEDGYWRKGRERSNRVRYAHAVWAEVGILSMYKLKRMPCVFFSSNSNGRPYVKIMVTRRLSRTILAVEYSQCSK